MREREREGGGVGNRKRGSCEAIREDQESVGKERDKGGERARMKAREGYLKGECVCSMFSSCCCFDRIHNRRQQRTQQHVILYVRHIST